MIIGIDFDGTIVKHEFPNIGDEVPFCKSVIKRLIANGHKIVLWTMRSDRLEHDENDNDVECLYLKEAVDYCIDVLDFKPWGINSNPEQGQWTSSPKAYCQIYIDDAALGCPLLGGPEEDVTYIPEDSKPRPYVDWLTVEKLLAEQGFFTEI